MDTTITKWINSWAGYSPVLDAAMIFVTGFGVPIMVLAVVAQWWGSGDRARIRHATVAAGLSFLLGEGLNQLVLLFVHRLRPYESGLTNLIIDRSTDWSFPSDHATAAIAIVAAFALLGYGQRAFLLFAAALLVCVSRVYVGTHYVTDILGGAATGTFAAIGVRLLYRRGTSLDRFLVGIF
jgi:undecaprenyl-diphosphatase